VQYATYGNSAYNMLRGPYYQSWDMNLGKNIRSARATVCSSAPRRSTTPSTIQNFGTPQATITNTQPLARSQASSTTPAASARTIEFVVKFNF